MSADENMDDERKQRDAASAIVSLGPGIERGMIDDVSRSRLSRPRYLRSRAAGMDFDVLILSDHATAEELSQNMATCLCLRCAGVSPSTR